MFVGLEPRTLKPISNGDIQGPDFAASRGNICYIGTSQKWEVFVEEENNPQKDE